MRTETVNCETREIELVWINRNMTFEWGHIQFTAPSSGQIWNLIGKLLTDSRHAKLKADIEQS